MKYDEYQQNFKNRILPVKLASSASDQNAYLTYVCLINEGRQLTGNDNDMNSPNQDRTFHVDDDELIEDLPIQVERSKALHELVESHKRNDSKGEHEVQRKPITIKSEDDLELSESDEYDQYVNLQKVKLTKTKWLTEKEREGSLDSRSPSLSPVNSSTSTCSRESDISVNHKVSYGEKCLSTILKLDREHNMFGLSNIAIVGKKTSKKIRKEDKPVFPQTTIIQICCVKGCCKHKSNTDLPTSLKCGGCHHCLDPCCPICVGSCGPPSDTPLCPSLCSQHPKENCICKASCISSKCRLDCSNHYGMKISFKRKPSFEPSPMELTPRSSCILQKPMAARTCHHLPQCVPPSSCFPYLMPCYWPARASAPCNHPLQCFHNPPCLPPRKKKIYYPIPPEEQCPTNEKCEDESKNKKCSNQSCPGNIPSMKAAIESKFGSKGAK